MAPNVLFSRRSGCEERARAARRLVVHVTLEDAWLSQDGGAFLRNVWPMYVHELSGFGADFYQLDSIGRWQPDIAEQWIARITPAANLRGVRSHDHTSGESRVG